MCASSARWTRSETCCGVATCSSCPPRPSRSGWRLWKRWRAACPSWRPRWGACPRWSATGIPGSWLRRARSMSWRGRRLPFSRTRRATRACGRRPPPGRGTSRASRWCRCTRRFTGKCWVREVLRLTHAPAPLVGPLGVAAGAAIALGSLALPPLAAWAALASLAFSAAGLVLARRREGPAPQGTADFLVFAGAVVGVGAAMLVGGPALVEQVTAGRRGPGLVIALAIGFVPASILLPARAGYGGAYFLIALFAQLMVLVVATRLIVGRGAGEGGAGRVSLLLQGAMLLGVVALVAGRVS